MELNNLEEMSPTPTMNSGSNNFIGVFIRRLLTALSLLPAYLNRKGGSDGNMSCTVLYTKYDNLRLASVASASKAEYMIGAEKNVHLFMAGNS